MYFKSSYGEIYYEVCGPEDSPAVSFIHGIFADHRLIKKAASVYKHEYRIIIWDMPEHGQSVKLEKDFDFSVAAKCFIELLDQLGVESVVLVGVSLGGMVGQYIAAKYPGRINGVAVEGAFPLHDNLRKVAFGFRAYSIMVRLTPWWLLTKLYNKMTAKMAVDDDIKEYMASVFLNMEKKDLLRHVDGAGKSILKGIGDPISQPVLITHGDGEMPLIRKMCARWHRGSPHSEYVVIRNAGHGAIFFNAEEYHHALQAFLKKVS